jgi:hypothetical protein
MLISWLGAVAAAAIAVGLFLPYRSSPFLYDDKFAILDNPIVTGSGPAVDAWTVDFWGHHRVDSPLSHKSFRPLITLWLRSDFRAWGASPANFRLTNAVLHGVASALVVPVYLAATAQRPAGKGSPPPTLLERRDQALIASAGAVLFAAHPVHSEAVMHIAARADIVAGILQFLAFIIWARARMAAAARSPVNRENPPWFMIAAWSAVVAITIVGVLAKETAVVIPLLCAAWDFFCFENFSLWHLYRAVTGPEVDDWTRRQRESLLRAASLAVAAVFLALLRLRKNGSAGPNICRNIEFNPAGCAEFPPVRWASIGWNWLEYLKVSAFAWLQPITCPQAPLGTPQSQHDCWHSFLSIDWSGDASPAIESILDARLVILAASTWCASIVVWKCFVVVENRPGAARAGAASVLLGVVPFLLGSNVWVTIGTARAERLLYAPVLGLVLFLAGLMVNQRRRRVLGGAAFVLVLALCCTATLQRNADWTSAEQLWFSAVRSSPTDVHALNLLALNQKKRGDYDGAIVTLRNVKQLPDPERWGGPTLSAWRALADLLEERALQLERGGVAPSSAAGLSERAEALDVRRRERALTSHLCAIEFREHVC